MWGMRRPRFWRRTDRMFEEGQLYAPVTADEDGKATVHLADDHPGANDDAYRRRRNDLTSAR